MLPCYLTFFAGNLFHFKANQEDYRIKPAEPLFVDKGNSKNMLNEFFFCVFSKVSFWQCMSELTVTTSDDVMALILDSTAFLSSKSGPKMPQVSCASRCLVAYSASFVPVAPFFRSVDPSVASRTDKYFFKALDTFSRLRAIPHTKCPFPQRTS